jgi:hypothetical protein
VLVSRRESHLVQLLPQKAIQWHCPQAKITSFAHRRPIWSPRPATGSSSHPGEKHSSEWRDHAFSLRHFGFGIIQVVFGTLVLVADLGSNPRYHLVWFPKFDLRRVSQVKMFDIYTSLLFWIQLDKHPSRMRTLYLSQRLPVSSSSGLGLIPRVTPVSFYTCALRVTYEYLQIVTTPLLLLTAK